ncbi:hypothetical protein BT63DRAFT_427548 [Microthyrium microscopicum]|uniref:Tat pathway signal sequence n=1 Tax=Microthyrium microscopicum TaxID=703497 RepID=A0A6A6U771_9PEZI|nr:hypothetical protein BT63DRAFT_427548 [Microthyrium microscopicum]
MSQTYQPVRKEEEKYHDGYRNRTSISSSSDLTLLHEEVSKISHDSQGFQSRWLWLVHAVLLSLSFTMFTATYFRHISTAEHVRRFSAYSPAVEAVEYENVKFNFTMGKKSPYTGKGPEVDKAWDALSYDIGDQMISPEELDIINMPKDSLKVKNPKTGVEGYRVGLEVFHQLHCINLLRQVTYKEYYTEIEIGNLAVSGEELQMHTDHCLEVLRVNTQCNADIGVFTFYMLEGDPLPWPELNSHHTCRNFDKVRQWGLKNSVGNMEQPDEF